MKRSTRWFLVLFALAAVACLLVAVAVAVGGGRSFSTQKRILAIELEGAWPERDANMSLFAFSRQPTHRARTRMGVATLRRLTMGDCHGVSRNSRSVRATRSLESVTPMAIDMFVITPGLALIPAGLFALLYVTSGRWLVAATAVVWLVYTVYEYSMHQRWLCTGDCNIRLDLLLLYPVLLVTSIVTASQKQLPR